MCRVVSCRIVIYIFFNGPYLGDHDHLNYFKSYSYDNYLRMWEPVFI